MLGKLSVKGKLMLGFGVLLVILAVLSIGAYRTLLSLNQAADAVEMRNQQEKLAASIPAAVMKQSSGTRGFLLSGQETALARDEEGKREFQESMDKLASMIGTDEGKSLLSEMQRSFGPFRAVADKEINLKRAGKEKEMVEVMSTQAGAASAAVDKATADFLAYTDRKKRESDETQNAGVSRGKVLIFSLCSVGIVVGFLVATLISRSLTGGIAGMVGMIQEMAGNNLGVPDLVTTSEDEVGKAGNLLNEMKNNLRELIHSIAGTAEHVASASEEISSSASLQAQSADTQKDQTSQVATAMQEMSSTVLQVSENSGKAADASRKAAETARQGGAIVNDTLTKMRAIAESVSSTAKKVEELGKSSDQIGRIIGVIDDIADQTNLLALNAAIEAARAGEQGRGFAVVADEVRKLAERTTTATKEIAQMISTVQEETKSAVAAMEEGTKQVEEGVQTTAQAGDSLKEIIHTSEQVGEMITHIATAATEQSSATEEINNNMEQIAKLVRESSEGAQQSAKACQDLSGLALDLQKMVSNFRLGEEQKDSYRGASKPHVVAREAGAKAMAAAAG
jgi:methyl-accepting chemotaxis protein